MDVGWAANSWNLCLIADRLNLFESRPPGPSMWASVGEGAGHRQPQPAPMSYDCRDILRDLQSEHAIIAEVET